MNEILLFGKCIDTVDVEFKTANDLAVTKGYLVHPDCCNIRVINFLKTLPDNYNTTFYSSWQDITSKDRFELFVDQLLHYASTYGTNHQGETYVPNTNVDTIDFTDCKLITPINVIELHSKITDLLYSGIALKDDTIKLIVSLLKEFSIPVNVSEIKNKEALMYICAELDILPNTPDEMVRYLVFKYTNTTLLIKSPELIRQIKNNKMSVSHLVQRFGVERLASVFYRFKPLFLAMKSGNESTINRLRRCAVTNHVPKQAGFWSKILSDVSLFPKITDQLSNLNNYKLVSLLQTILVRKQETGIMPVTVRNGKLFVTERKFGNKNYYDMVYNILYTELVKRLSKKACTVKLNPNINLALPTSEKSFIGNIPFGSSVNLGKDSIVGINWKGVDGAQDLDLSLIDVSGNKFGWNSNFYNGDKSVVYSGDMTSANPEATELMYCKAGMPDSSVRVNLFYGNPNSKYTLFFAAIPNFTPERNHMVDPNDIIFSTQLEIKGEQIAGVFVNKKFFFMDLSVGNGRVSRNSKYTQDFIIHKSKTSNCYLDIAAVLADAGFTFVQTNADLDLTVSDRSLLISLLKHE